MAKTGRPTKYKPEYCQELIDHFNDTDGYPSFEEFAISKGVCRDTLIEWTKTYPEFSDAYKRAKDRQSYTISKNALTGVWKEGFCKFLMINNHGYRSEKVSQDITSDGEKLMPRMEIIVQSQETADELRKLAEGK